MYFKRLTIGILAVIIGFSSMCFPDFKNLIDKKIITPFIGSLLNIIK